MIITYEQLVALDACKEEKQLFKETFGKQLELPIDYESQKSLAKKLMQSEFDLHWCWKNLISEEKRENFRHLSDLIHQKYEWDLIQIHFKCEDQYLYYKECDKLFLEYKISKWLFLIQVLTNTYSLEGPDGKD